MHENDKYDHLPQLKIVKLNGFESNLNHNIFPGPFLVVQVERTHESTCVSLYVHVCALTQVAVNFFLLCYQLELVVIWLAEKTGDKIPQIAS